jgi:hypothetical protein
MMIKYAFTGVITFVGSPIAMLRDWGPLSARAHGRVTRWKPAKLCSVRT